MGPAFQFESDMVGGPWLRCRIWPDMVAMQADEEGGEVFEIEEPVWLQNSLVQPQEHIYWIREFTYEGPDQAAWVKLSWGPPEVSSEKTAFIPVQPKHLRKLTEMHRIAAEASRP
jgi:hypothetical protein